MSETLQVLRTPELVFGLVAPIGVDLNLVIDVLHATLKEMGYASQDFKLTELMLEIPVASPTAFSAHYVQSYREKISYANKVRTLLGDNAMAVLAVSAIRAFRKQEWERRSAETPRPRETKIDTRENPIPAQAYIIRQFKRPEEIALMRQIYGRQFILVSAYVSQEVRRRRIEEGERSSRGTRIDTVEAHNLAYELVAQDAKQDSEKHGQNVRDAFPLGDVFIDATTRLACEQTVRRFIHLFFGNNEITPTRDEYGMYMAKSASLRSSDLSRQVGAAIFRPSGEVLTLGCNEVPKGGGGTYWVGDDEDARDFVLGQDPNEQRKMELLVDLISRLKDGKYLAQSLRNKGDPTNIVKALMESPGGEIKNAKIMDLLEFGRILHAEMSAITDAARKGIPLKGSLLFTTTFPCHICAKHIVAAGISQVVYLEPYPKSYATDLHGDSIGVEDAPPVGKVFFRPFIGVSPFRYRDLFEKGKRKYAGGKSMQWNKGERAPIIEVYFPSYFEAEVAVVTPFNEALKKAGTPAEADVASP